MEGNNKAERFIQKIFERSANPLAQLERINSIVPIFFAKQENVETANNELDSYGYQVNEDYVTGIRSEIQMFAHPACGSSNDYESGHPSCSGSSNGYRNGHSACGNSNSYGRGHASCASINKEKGKSLLLIRKNNNGKRNETRIPRFGI